MENSKYKIIKDKSQDNKSNHIINHPMGNNSYRHQSTDHSEYISPEKFELILYETHNHENLFTSQVIPHKDQKNGTILKRTVHFSSSSENILDYISRLNSIGKLVECENLYLPLTCIEKGEEIMCNDKRTLQMFFENYDVKIYEEIIARKHQKEKFTEEEVWYILYSVIKAVKSFERVKRPSGFLKTQHILLNERGHLKLLNILSYPQVFSSHETHGKSKTLKSFYGKSQVISAPEELKILREGMGKRPNPNISQTFSIGIVMLEICSFINGQRFYDMDIMKINDLTVKRGMEVVEKSYSRLLFNLIRTMISPEFYRPLPSQIYTAFKPYEKSIVNLVSFKFETSFTTKDSFSNTSYRSF